MSEKWDSADGSGIMGPTVVTHVAYSGKERAPSEQNTNTYNKPDLARILVEGTKAVYGQEKSEQLNAEFERQRQQPPRLDGVHLGGRDRRDDDAVVLQPGRQRERRY